MTNLETAKKFLAECRFLLVEESKNSCLKESGRESQKVELSKLDEAIAGNDLGLCQDRILHVVVLSSFRSRTAKDRGLAKRVRNFAESVWPADYHVRREES